MKKSKKINPENKLWVTNLSIKDDKLGRGK
jgi:hypothetical protein